MSTHPPQDAINELTAEAHHAHATSLQREVGQLRIVKEGLKARVTDLEARIADLQQAMGQPGKRIADLQQRLERAVEANVTLRQENARLYALGDAALRATIEDQAFTIHVHEKSLAEYAATVCTMQKRIAELECQLRQSYADRALLRGIAERRTQLVVDATLRKAG